LGTVCLAMNIKRRAVTNYHGISFNSFCIFRGTPVMLGDSAIYKFGYEFSADGSADIDAFAEFVATDFGIDNHKHIRSTHLSYMSDGDLKLEWWADELSTRAEDVVSESDSSNYRNIKIKGNRKVEGTYFQYKVSNYKGADFTLNSIRAVPIVQNLGKSN